MTESGYIYTPHSVWRALLESECRGYPNRSQLLHDNAYGEVLFVDVGGEKSPVICRHGGSMWLCRECSYKLRSLNQSFGVD